MPVLQLRSLHGLKWLSFISGLFIVIAVGICLVELFSEGDDYDQTGSNIICQAYQVSGEISITCLLLFCRYWANRKKSVHPNIRINRNCVRIRWPIYLSWTAEWNGWAQGLHKGTACIWTLPSWYLHNRGFCWLWLSGRSNANISTGCAPVCGHPICG